MIARYKTKEMFRDFNRNYQDYANALNACLQIMKKHSSQSIPHLGKVASWGVRKIWKEWLGPKYNARTHTVCRFHPNCSSYAIMAFERYGFIGGALMAIKRIRRCNPSNTDSCIDFPTGE